MAVVYALMPLPRVDRAPAQGSGTDTVKIVDGRVIQMCDLPMGECAFEVMGRDYDHDDWYAG